MDGLWTRQRWPGSPKELGAASDFSSFSGTSFAPDGRFRHQSSQSRLATDYEDYWDTESGEETPTENYNEENSEQHPRFSLLRKRDFFAVAASCKATVLKLRLGHHWHLVFVLPLRLRLLTLLPNCPSLRAYGS